MMPNSMKIISVDDLCDGDISRLFYVARSMQRGEFQAKKRNGVQPVLLAFMEPSTRTRLSFEMACHMLGAGIISFDASKSSLNKGESILETFKTFESLAPSALVLRQASKFDETLLGGIKLNIINAGDGGNEHPTQALLDCFTLLTEFQSDDLRGRRILICGDVGRSRVYNSNLKLMQRLGAVVSVMSPKILGASGGHFQDFSGIRGPFDAVMMLRLQEERMEKKQFIDRQNYFLNFGLTSERFKRLGPKCFLMHPGPLNIGVEIEHSIINHERSLIHKQVRNGVLIRAAAMNTMFGLGG